jgi:hypothetical protein
VSEGGLHRDTKGFDQFFGQVVFLFNKTTVSVSAEDNRMQIIPEMPLELLVQMRSIIINVCKFICIEVASMILFKVIIEGGFVI